MEGPELELFDRGIRHATASASGETLDAALADLGWRDALIADRRAAVSLLFECQGAANVSSSALLQVLAVGLGRKDDRPPPAVLPPLRTRRAPGRLTGDRCAIRGLATAQLDGLNTVLVVAEVTDEHAAFAVPTSALSRRPISGIDPPLGMLEVTGEVALEDTVPLGAVDWTAMVALGQLALGHELVGTARAMLELACTHALERIQFGRPISTFQAVRHRLADSLVAIEAAGALLAAAWDDPSPVNASMAKSTAGRGARTVARHCQQVLAGIGFTTEHPFHRYYRRALVLDQLLGAGSLLTAELGTGVLRSRTLPPLLPL
jgi:alkylation response protein AidB-like acyl-CoA dehydrogenase